MNAAILLLALLVPTAGTPERLPLPDRGIFADLDAQVRIERPAWLKPAACRDPLLPVAWLIAFDSVVGFSSPDKALPPCAAVADTDGDGVPDPLDVLAGAKKTVLDHAPYGSPYRTIPYPNGDVPRSEGVCTDVVIRALRNAGIDLQRLVHEDIARAPKAYPMVRRPNPSIDHRRVKTLLPWFQRHWMAQQTERDRIGDWLPGDVVFMDTLAKPGPDHIGVVSDHLGPSGRPLIINSWTDGYRTAEMDLMAFVPVTHRFRAPRVEQGTPATALAAVGYHLPETTRQLVVVRVPDMGASRGVLTRWQRGRADWQPVGQPVPVDVGAAGVAWGRGLGPQRQPAKVEGDHRSPLGAFHIGTAFGRTARPAGVAWPWRQTGADDRWVDEPRSPHYNRWVSAQDAGKASAEILARADGLYDLALVLEHNTDAPVPGAGSAIFVHLTSGRPTVGCTSLAREPLLELLQWLRPAARPVWVQVVE